MEKVLNCRSFCTTCLWHLFFYHRSVGQWKKNVPFQKSHHDLLGSKCTCSLGIQSPCQMMIGVYNHLLSKVFRFHYHSQKVIGSLGILRLFLIWVVATQILFIFTPKIGEDEPILTIMFFKGVGEKPPTSCWRTYILLGSFWKVWNEWLVSG